MVYGGKGGFKQSKPQFLLAVSRTHQVAGPVGDSLQLQLRSEPRKWLLWLLCLCTLQLVALEIASQSCDFSTGSKSPASLAGRSSTWNRQQQQRVAIHVSVAHDVANEGCVLHAKSMQTTYKTTPCQKFFQNGPIWGISLQKETKWGNLPRMRCLFLRSDS